LVNEESVQEICRQIMEDGEKEVNSILDKARRTIEEIKLRARKEGEEAAQKIIKEAETKAQALKKRTLSSVSLEAKRERLKIREELYREVISELKVKLGNLRSTPEYADVLKRLILEAVKALGKDRIVIYVDNKDRIVIYVDKRDIAVVEKDVVSAVKENLSSEGIDIEEIKVAELDREILGGVMVAASEGNVMYDNTFESRMYRAESEIRSYIYSTICPE